MKRFIIAGVAAATLAGGAFAFADSLSVTSNNLASGAQVVVQCQSEAVTVHYTLTYSSTPTSEPAGTGGYYVTGVQLTGIKANDSTHNCVGQAATIELAGTSGTALGSASIATLAADAGGPPPTTNTATVSPATVDAYQLKNVSVVITGAHA